MLGSGAAVAGAAIYYGVLELLHINAALVTILIGFWVGKMVRKGSGGRGGWRYQILAAFLTYCAIALAYVPPVYNSLKSVRDGKASAEVAAKDLTPGISAAASAKPEEAAAATTEQKAPAETDQADTDKAATSSFKQLPKPLRVAIAWVFVAVVAFIAPVANDFPDILNLLIIGFGMMQAWRLTKAARIEVTGPHALGEAPLQSTVASA